MQAEVDRSSNTSPIIRAAAAHDIGSAAQLLVRLKRLNGEFDPMFAVREDSLDRAKKYLEEAIAGQTSVVLVAEEKGKIVGLVKADLKDRIFYEPKIAGAIVDFYIYPEYRRRKLGQKLIQTTVDKLKQKGAQIVTAEFPAQNIIATNFYEKNGFRRLFCIYAAKSPEEA